MKQVNKEELPSGNIRRKKPKISRPARETSSKLLDCSSTQKGMLKMGR